MLIVVPLQCVLALAMTMLLRQVKHGRDLILWVWSIPLGISDLAAGLVWLAILTDRGWLNTALFRLGVIPRPEAWLTYETPLLLLAAIVVAEMWRGDGDRFVILLAGVQMLPKEYEEAAEVFGATPWQRFLRVTLPLLKPSLQTALILRTRAGAGDVRDGAGAGRPEFSCLGQRRRSTGSIWPARIMASPPVMPCW